MWGIERRKMAVPARFKERRRAHTVAVGLSKRNGTEMRSGESPLDYTGREQPEGLHHVLFLRADVVPQAGRDEAVLDRDVLVAEFCERVGRRECELKAGRGGGGGMGH